MEIEGIRGKDGRGQGPKAGGLNIVRGRILGEGEIAHRKEGKRHPRKRKENE